MAPNLRKAGVNFYAVLETREEADEASIKKEYRRLVLKWHPDKHPHDKRAQAEEKIRSINAAYEVLSNPTKRETYDLQRLAMDKRKRGVVPAATRVSPRMAAPKEFMMQPIGHPESFLRCEGRRMHVHTRGDVRTDFQTFFKGTKFSLWWLPDVNNMCRVRSHGSKTKHDKKAVAAGLAGGLNLTFNVNREDLPGESEVTLSIANKGQKKDKVNLIAKVSPVYEGAFRFETACRRGSYMAFVPPTGLRIVPFLDDESTRVLDFMLVDFSTMIRFQDLEEVLLPATSSSSDAGSDSCWVPVSKIREDPNVKSYFKTVLDKPMWDTEDFATYFQGHWTVWEYRDEDHCVRLRASEERLTRTLTAASGFEAVAYALAESGEELKKIHLESAMNALLALAEAPLPEDEEDTESAKKRQRLGEGRCKDGGDKAESDVGDGGDMDPRGKRADLVSDCTVGRTRLLGALPDIYIRSRATGCPGATLQQLMDAAEKALTLGGKRPGYDVMLERKAAARIFADLAFARVTPSSGAVDGEIACGKSSEAVDADAVGAVAGKQHIADVPSDADLHRMLRLPGASDHQEVLKPLYDNFIRRIEPRALSQALVELVASSCDQLIDSATSIVLEKLDLWETDEAAVALQALAELDSRHEDVASAVRFRAPAFGSQELASVLIALSDRGFDSDNMKIAAECLASKAPLTMIKPGTQLALAIAATKRKSMKPVVEPIAHAASTSVSLWPVTDIIRFLLAVSKTKDQLLPITLDSLLEHAAKTLSPAQLDVADLAKLALAAAALGGSSVLLEVVAARITSRVDEFTLSQLLLATQGLVQGLGLQHEAVGKLLVVWPRFLTAAANAEVAKAAQAKGSCESVGVGSSKDFSTRGGNLSVEELAKLVRTMTPLEKPNQLPCVCRDICDAAGSLLLQLARANDVSEAGRALLLEHLERGGGLSSFAGGDALRALLLKGAAMGAAAAGNSEPKKKKKRRR
eukprot:TRINITY_DN56162_c0_g1_i1.p1 TRINITY_DN56162_c0_g1~~TRINITY_DN56162_c0_g1_i1.p1  ORF type:complete len:978 (+),score=193.32 TRINITY_DN56162_c0_g1_i1:99-3032(+)